MAPTATKQRTCIKCKDNHTLCHCKEFTTMEPAERCEYVKTNQLCFNCLAPGHAAKKCRLNMSCRICHKRHHSLVHQQAQSNISNQQVNMQAKHHQIEEHQQQEAYEQAELSSHFTASTSTALLATALVPVSDMSGRMTILRALVDQGSQATFISERAAQLLKLKRTPAQATVKGVGSTTTAIKHAAQIELRSRHDDSFKLQVKAYIMATRITTQLPSQTIPINTCSHLEGLKLADPSFNKPGRVDLLLGVEVCAQIIRSEFIKGPPGSPCAQNTSLGWILFGNILNEGNKNDFIVMHHSLDLNKMLKAMWELDNEDKSKLTKDERKCEQIYQSTHSRTQDGQYIKGGFTLQKWCSNDANFLKQFDPAKRTTHAILDITLDGTITALGLRWNMGRIVTKYPGDDGVTRVYGVKSGDSITKRSFNKLCPLPIDVDD
ncbi:hypothetical protein HF086_017577 [Spodoptera exigua]|uniref:CCHC-type domain-containing protein n=1 Tax=Spodoptera exigua TaxID=7107 RepID=A0A922MJA2_SPOEX|nr:hypothetical protein HF086_017577 [Spodoptera exigua]